MKSFYLLFLFLLTSLSLNYAQTIDETFKEPLLEAPSRVKCIKVLSDGKILVGGDIAYFKSKPVNNLIRLTSDSTIDETFKFTGDKKLLIQEIELQSTGDLVVLAREYESLTNVYWDNYSLFLIDHSGNIKKQIDTLKNLNSIAIQGDDKILVCGKNNSKGYIYRYKKDLSLDDSFNNKITFNNEVTDVVTGHDRLYASGSFSIVNDTIMNNVVKLNINGGVDNSFNPGTGTADYIGSLTIQNDGKILLGNTYINSFNGISKRGLARLNSDGTVDQKFNPSTGTISKIFVQDTSIYFATFKEINSKYGSYLLKLSLSGSIDTSFHPILINNTDALDFNLDFNKNDLIFNNSNKYGLSKCDSIGKINIKFSPEISRWGIATIGDCLNGKLILAGDFIKVNKIETFGITMLDKNGTVDQSFILKKNMGPVIQIKILNDSNILVSTGKYFFKLNNKAEISQEFKFQSFKTLYNVLKFKVLENNKIMAADPNNVYRLNSDGSEDTSFDIGIGLDPVRTSFDFDTQNDKVILGSAFTKFNGTDVNRMIRLNYDGTIDQTFNIGSGPNSSQPFYGVDLIKVLDNSEIIVMGDFERFNGMITTNGIVKLTSNGKVDSVFYENFKKSSVSLSIYGTKINQIGSRLYFYGSNSIKVINIDGSVDESFRAPFSINRINDFILLKENSSKKSTFDNHVFAIGNFSRNGVNSPSNIIKLSINNISIPSSIKEKGTTNFDFQLYPVPVKNKLHVKTNSLSQSKIEIYNLTGIKIYNSIISQDNMEIDLSNYSAGIYFVKVTTPSGEEKTKTIEKQ